MSPKKIVKAFYDSDLATAENVKDMFHDDCVLNWHSSQGFKKIDKKGVVAMIDDVRKSYLSFTYKLSHLLVDENVVTARYTVYTTPIERPNKEDAIAHFISIWEVKNKKLYRGFEISQQLDGNQESLSSFSEIKI